MARGYMRGGLARAVRVSCIWLVSMGLAVSSMPARAWAQFPAENAGAPCTPADKKTAVHAMGSADESPDEDAAVHDPADASPEQELPVDVDAPPGRRDLPEGVEGLDFGNRRLIVATERQPTCGEVISAYEGVWLLEFESAAEAAWAYVELLDSADFVAPDQTVKVASEDNAGPAAEEPVPAASVGEDLPALPLSSGDAPARSQEVSADAPTAELSRIGEADGMQAGAIALIDTGVASSRPTVARTSVIGSVEADDNGHGSAMYDLMREVDPAAEVVSIKALDQSGQGSAASVYAAIESAIEMRVKVINLSLCAVATEGNAAVEAAIRDAHGAGISVVGAAGNDGRDARWYVPGRMGDEAVIVGSCDPEGKRLASSNYGETVDLYVPSASTSGAAAKVSAWLGAHGTFGREVAQLASEKAQRDLGARTETDMPDDRGVPEGPEVFTAAKGDSYLSLKAEWRAHPITGESWTKNGGRDAGGGDGYGYQQVAIQLTNNDGVGGSVRYQAHLHRTGNTGEVTGPNNCGTSGQRREMEDIRVWLTGDIAKCYDCNYTVLMSSGKEYRAEPQPSQTITTRMNDNVGYSGFAGKTFSAKNGAWTHSIQPTAWSYTINGNLQSIAANEQNGGCVAIRKLTLSLTPKSYTHRVLARYQNANGTYPTTGGTQVFSKSYAYNAAVPAWSTTATATYKSATRAAYTAGYENKDVYLNVPRQTYSLNINCYNPSGAETYTADAEHAAFFDISYDGGTTWQNNLYNEPTGSTPRVGQTIKIRNVRAGTGLSVTKVENAGTPVNGVYTITMPAQAVTVNIRTASTAYRVYFDLNNDDAQGAVGPVEATRGTQFLLPTQVPVSELDTFVGWNTKADGSGATYAPGAAVKDLAPAGIDTATLYARWEAKQMRVAVPVALRYVADTQGTVRGPADGEVCVINEGETCVELDGLRAEPYDPWRFVADEADLGPHELALGTRIGEGDRLSFCDLAGQTQRYGWLPPGERLLLYDNMGQAGSGDLGSEVCLGCLHWHFRMARASEA